MLQLQVTIRAEAPRCGDVPLFRYVLQYTVQIPYENQCTHI